MNTNGGIFSENFHIHIPVNSAAPNNGACGMETGISVNAWPWYIDTIDEC